MIVCLKGIYARVLPDMSKKSMLLKSVLLVFILFLSSVAYCQDSQKLINEIVIRGNDQVPTDVIMTNIRSRPEAFFNEKLVAEDSRRIIIMPQIQNVTWLAEPVEGQADRVNVVFLVAEAVTVRGVEFSGNKKFNDKKLAGRLPFSKDDYLDRYLVSRGVQEIESYYRDNGYYFASVTVDDSRADSDGVVVYKIDEGPKLKITKVKFLGRESFPGYKIKNQTKTRASFLIFNKGRLDDLKLESDVDAIAQYYHEEGFLDAQVSAEKIFSDDNSKLEINFLIDEGPRYVLKDIAFSGNKLYDNDKFRDSIELAVGMYARDESITLAQRAITRLYGGNGYIYAQVRPELRYTDLPGEVILNFDIDEGKKYYLNKIIITGNYETRDKVVRRDFDRHGFLPGEVYDVDAADKARRRLAGSGIFSSVDIEPVGDYPDRRDALVEVGETNTGMLLFGVGVDTNNGLLGQFSVEQRNFDASRKPESLKELLKGNAYVGGGQRLRLSIEPGTDMTRANLKFYEPYLNDQPIYLDYNLFLFKRYRESYQEKRRGTSLTLGHRFENDWSIEGTVKVEMVDVGDFDYKYYRSDSDPNTFERRLLTPDEVMVDAGDNLLTSFKFGIGRNTTDRLYRPSEGYKFNMAVEQFGVFGGDFSFTELSSGITFYNTLYEDIVERRTIWSTKISGSKIYGYAPVFERFYAGGMGTLRGFDYRGVGRRGGLGRDPIGSNYILMAGTEISHPLFEETLFGKLFCDSVYLDDDQVRVTVGFGMELIIPQFFQEVPMNFDFGFPLVEGPEDEKQMFSFNFGMSF